MVFLTLLTYSLPFWCKGLQPMTYLACQFLLVRYWISSTFPQELPSYDMGLNWVTSPKWINMHDELSLQFQKAGCHSRRRPAPKIWTWKSSALILYDLGHVRDPLLFWNSHLFTTDDKYCSACLTGALRESNEVTDMKTERLQEKSFPVAAETQNSLSLFTIKVACTIIGC